MEFQADFGADKYRVGVQIKSGAYVPPGTTTLGSEIQIVQRLADGTVDTTSTCTTDIAGAGTVSYCGTEFFSTPGDTVELTQMSAPAGLVVDPTVITLGPCTAPVSQFGCPIGDQLFTDNGLPPDATADTARVVNTTTVDIPVLANDDLHGAPLTDLQISAAPAHGTATVVTSSSGAGASTPVVHYVPAPGYVGPDTLHYTVTTANGTATGTVTISVLAPPPTAANDRASTTEGHPVSIDVTANDDAMGGGALRVDSVGNPAHGTARIDGTAVVYRSAAGFVGTDRFSYVVATAYGSATATVTVQVVGIPTTTPAAPQDNGSGGLASTGTDTSALITLAGGLLIAGGAATAGGRRRRSRRAH